MKIKFSFLTILFIFFSFFFHLEKTILFLFCILSVHEIFHIIIAGHFGYICNQVTILPFGLVAEIPQIGFSHHAMEWMIYLAGPLSQLIFIPVLYLLWNNSVISYSYMVYLNQMNLHILIFNLLPIYPLDGGRFLLSVLHIFFPFQKAEKISYLLSSFVLLYVSLKRYLIGYGGFFVCIYLWIQLFHSFFYIKSKYLSFLYYRLHHPVTGKVKYHGKQDIYRFYENYLYNNNKWIAESVWIREKIPVYKTENHKQIKQTMI